MGASLTELTSHWSEAGLAVAPADLETYADRARSLAVALRQAEAHARQCSEVSGIALPEPFTVQSGESFLAAAIEWVEQQRKEEEERLRREEEERRRLEEARALLRRKKTATTMLARVRTLRHESGGDFDPLVEAQDRAAALEKSIAECSADVLPALVADLEAGTNPFCALLEVAERIKDIDDTTWGRLERTIEQAFSRPLAVAALRGKVLPPETPKPAAPPAVPAAAPPPALPRRELEIRDILREFFPAFLDSAEELLENDASGQIALRRVRERKVLGGKKLNALSEEQVRSAVAMLEAWFGIRKRKNADPAAVAAVATGLGFKLLSTPKVLVSRRRMWLELETEPVADGRVIPAPRYGSRAGGRYRILCLWDKLLEADLAEECATNARDHSVMVWYFGIFSETERRNMALLNMNRRLTMTVLDEPLLLFLCAETGPRLPALFECTLPFTYSPLFEQPEALAPEMFFGREAELASLTGLTGVLNLTGPPGSGKSALMAAAARAFHRPEEGRRARYVDLRSEDVFPLDPEESWLGMGGTRRVLLLLDHAGPLFASKTGAVDRIRSAIELSRGRLSVVFALDGTALPAGHFFSAATGMTLGPFRDDDPGAMELLERPWRAMGFRFASDELPAAILSQTGYLPSRIQSYCRELFRHFTAIGMPAFNPQTSPPYVIRSKHLQDAAQNPAVRKTAS